MIYTQETPDLHPLLKQFFKTKHEWPSCVMRYETLDPDACIWLLATEFFAPERESSYLVYLRDFITGGLPEVREDMAKFFGTTPHKIELLPVLHEQKFEKASPVTAADTYKPPEDVDDFMKYAGTYKFYFVLCGEVR